MQKKMKDMLCTYEIISLFKIQLIIVKICSALLNFVMKSGTVGIKVRKMKTIANLLDFFSTQFHGLL